MSAEWNCEVCGTSVLGSTCPNESNQDHRIAALEAENTRLRELVRAVFDEELVCDADWSRLREAVKEASSDE